MILKKKDIINIEDIAKKEFLLTNGLGGYCSSSLINCHTRKYHGLLVAPVESISKKIVFLNNLWISLKDGGKEFLLSTFKFPKVYSPSGYQYIDKIKCTSYPEVHYKIADNEIVQTILMPENENSVFVKIDLKKSNENCTLKIMPFFSCRENHELGHENLFIRPKSFVQKNIVKFDPYEGLPAVYMKTSEEAYYYPAPEWWKSFKYLEEKSRGYDFLEDLFSPGLFEMPFSEGSTFIFKASIQAQDDNDIKAEWDSVLKSYKQKEKAVKDLPEELKTISLNSDVFLLNADNNKAGITAGYPWFSEWGRDTMIALCGLSLSKNKNKEALNILERYAGGSKNGLIPNLFMSNGQHVYNSVDASLYFFWAVQKYIDYTDDIDSVREKLLPFMLSCVKSFINSEPEHIYIDSFGFLNAGTENTQLTWMDAEAEGRPVTPRNGAAIELNALFYNGMKMLLKYFSEDIDLSLKKEIQEASGKIKNNFEEKFWNEKSACFLDVFRENSAGDSEIRPNQLFVMGLSDSLVCKEKSEKALDTIIKHLVCPYGLRTLSPSDINYHPRYMGTQTQRDKAYHQGTVWPWLTGIFYDAMVNVHGKDQAGSFVIDNFSKLWTDHLTERGLNHISEIFSAVDPYIPDGCPAQAWSESEIYRVLDKIFIKNKGKKT